jgi:hypothetical protein
MFQQLIASRETKDFEIAMILLITMSSKPMGFLRVLRFLTTWIVDKDKPPTDSFTIIVVP